MRRIGAVLTGSAFALGALAVGAQPASAATVKVIASPGANIRSRPNTDTDSSVIGGLFYGAPADIDCYVVAEAVTGPYGTENIWDHLTSGGYIADALVYTGSSSPIVPACDQPASPTTPSLTSSPGNTYPIAWTGIGVYPRAGASMASGKVGNVLPDGANVTVTCETPGDSVTDTAGYTSSVWDKLVDGTYVANAFLNTGANGWTPGVPRCELPDSPPATTTNAFFDRNKTAAWATAHALDPQSYGAMCAWFVSNALWAGGFPKSDTWTDQGQYYSTTGTPTEWLVPNLLAHLQANFSTTLIDLGDMSINAVPQAEVGDIIAYDWGDGDGISHLAVVVDIQPGQYPNVSEMGQYNWGLNDLALSKIGIGKSSSYQERGWTYSKKTEGFLQIEFKGKVHAWLLHFNGGYYLPSY